MFDLPWSSKYRATVFLNIIEIRNADKLNLSTGGGKHWFRVLEV